MSKGKPISYAAPPAEPEPSESTTPHGLAPSFVRFNTKVRLYLISTGDDPGDECELGGNIQTNWQFENLRAHRTIDIELPVKKNFENQNNGLGFLLAELDTRTIGAPANLSGYLVEEGSIFRGDKIILSYSVDWNTAPLAWADGRSWRVKSWNSSDHRYACYLWWRVTQV